MVKLDNLLYTSMAILDFQNSFDTVDHDILLCKLISIGIDDNCVNWFQSYLNVKKLASQKKLSLHLGKQSQLYLEQRKLNIDSKLKIECNGNIVKCESRVKYLGLSIDQNMSGCAMANSIIFLN